MDTLEGLKRSHHCGDLRKEQVEQEIVLCGWVARRRDHGGLIFVDLRDRSGFVQVVFSEKEMGLDAFKKAEALRSEFVVAVRGQVRARSATCAAFKSCEGVSRETPRAKYSAALIEFAAFKLKSPIPRSECKIPVARTSTSQSRLFRKSTIRASPGFSTRGLATRTGIPAAFTRSTEGRSPYRSR